jgi:putative endonuclease
MPYVYILASISRVLYVGSTENIQQRVLDHRARRGAAFTKKYRVNRLVYFESAESLSVARRRELVLKAWRREKKIALIESLNPDWKDLGTPASDVSSWVRKRSAATTIFSPAARRRIQPRKCLRISGRGRSEASRFCRPRTRARENRQRLQP